MDDFITLGNPPGLDFTGQVTLEAYKNGKRVGTLRPEQRLFAASGGQTTTTVALHSTPKEDLYVVLAGVSENSIVCQIKAFVNPLVFWVWFGSADEVKFCRWQP